MYENCLCILVRVKELSLFLVDLSEWDIYSCVVCGCVYLGFVSVSGGLGSSWCLFHNVMFSEFGGVACMCLLSI